MSIEMMTTQKCSHPSCQSPATHTWALVPVCRGHHEAILVETVKYYLLGGRTRRVMYERIRHLTPWGRLD